MRRWIIESIGPDCANQHCTNRVGEGPFELVKLGDDRERRPGAPEWICLLLCQPCSDRLQEIH